MDAWQKLLDGERDELRAHLEDERNIMSRGLRLVRCFICRVQLASKTGLHATVCKDGKMHLLCHKCREKVQGQ